MLDGHKLLVQLSQRKRLPDDGGTRAAKAPRDKANATKLVRPPSCSWHARCIAGRGTRMVLDCDGRCGSRHL